jgi:UDP:flavonoid glycosyltransferase YjiC (YdhE family)
VRVLLAAIGSRGDVQPMLALGLALRDAGHEITVSAPSNFRDWTVSLGFSYSESGQDLQSWLLRQNRFALDAHTASIEGLRHYYAELIPTQFQRLRPLVPQVDLVVSTGLDVAARSLAELSGARHCYLCFCPQLIPSVQHPPVLMGRMGMPRWVNRWSWYVCGRIFDRIMLEPLNEQREALGLQRLERVPRGAAGAELAIVAADPEIAPAPNDMIHGLVQTGFIYYAQKATENAALEDFLADGPPPVYIGFGSMAHANPQRTTAIVLEAVRRAGCRALLAAGWAGLGEAELPDHCLHIRQVAHGPLFPRLAAAVHHGGSGTVATAARAGIPQVIVPHHMDQFYWGHRIHASGLGPKPVPMRKLRPERLASAIRKAIGDESTRRRSKEVAAGIETRDGLGETVQILDRFVEDAAPA